MKKTLKMLGLVALMGTMMVACGGDNNDPIDNPSDDPTDNPTDNPVVEGDGNTTVSWDGEQWTTKSVYSVYYENGSVTLEIYKDPADPMSPLVVLNVPMRTGTWYATQGSYEFMCLYYDYPSQTGTYNGMEVPPYQPTQGAYITITAFDTAAHKFNAHMEGYFIHVDNYQQGDNTMYPLTVDFSASEYIDMMD